MTPLFFEKFFSIWEDTEIFGQRIIRAGIISFLERVIIKSLSIVRTIIIARLLFPNDIGLFGLASLVLTTVEVFFQTGFNAAIIQSQDDVEKHLDSVWTVNVIRGLSLFTLVYFVAPFAAIFFNNVQAIVYIRVLAALFLIQGFENIGILLYHKELRFHKQFLYDVLGPVIQIVVVIIAASILHNTWALIIGALIGRASFLVLSYIYHPFRPRFRFDLTGARHLFKFGKWIALTGILSYFVGQGDSLTIGRLLTPSDLAYYSMAFALGTLPATEVVNAMGDIFFPLYANIKNDLERLKSAFLRISRVIYSLMIPACVGILVLSRPIVHFVYGERWLPMVPILTVVVFYGLIRSFEYLANPLLQGIGKPHTTLINLLLQALVMFSIIVPLTIRYGAVGTAWAMLIGLLVAVIFLMQKVKAEVHFGFTTLIATSWVPVLASLVMAGVLILVQRLIPIGNIFIVFVYVAIGAVTYGGAVLILDRIFNAGIWESITWIRQNL